MFGLGSWELVLIAVVVLVGLALMLLVTIPLMRRIRSGETGGAAGSDVRTLQRDVATLRAELRTALRHTAVVRYDAFGDTGGQLSWSVALLDGEGDGVVLTAIHGRSEVRSYAKDVRAWRAQQQLSPEEEEALTRARA